MTRPAAVQTVYNFRAVDERLCTSGQPTEAQLAEIAAAGFTTVINLALHDDPRYSLKDERGTAERAGLTYVHIPVQFGAPTREDLLEFFAAMDRHSDDKLWVHCAANIRVTSFLGLYRVMRLGWAEPEAFALMRSIGEPNEVWAQFITGTLEQHGRP